MAAIIGEYCLVVSERQWVYEYCIKDVQRDGDFRVRTITELSL